MVAEEENQQINLQKNQVIKLFDRQIVHLAAAQIGIDDLSEDNLRNLENNVTPLSLSFIPFFNFGSRNTGFNNDVFY